MNQNWVDTKKNKLQNLELLQMLLNFNLSKQTLLGALKYYIHKFIWITAQKEKEIKI